MTGKGRSADRPEPATRRAATGILAAAALLAGALVLLAGLSGTGAVPDPFLQGLARLWDVDPSMVLYRQAGEWDLAAVSPRALALFPDGTVGVAGERTLLVLGRSGEVLRRTALPLTADCLTVDPVGRVYLGAGGRVLTVAPGGHAAEEWVDLGQIALVTSIAAGQSVFVADAGQRSIWRFDAGGRLLGRIDGAAEGGFSIPGPEFDVALSPEGEVWAANPGRHRVERYSLNGLWRGSWGRASMDVDGFAGCCNPVHLAVLPDGALAVSEKGIGRVKVVEVDGALRGVAAAPRDLGVGSRGLDLAAGRDGRLYVLERRRGAILVFEKRQEGGGPA